MDLKKRLDLAYLTLDKVGVLDLVQLEDDIGYFKSSLTDLSSSY